MIKRYILLLCTLLSITVHSQTEVSSFTSCAGCLNIFKSNKYHLTLKGEEKVSSTFAEFPSLSTVTSSNQIWISYIAPARGTISFSAKAKSSKLKMIIFQPFSGNVCSEVKDGMAEIKRLAIKGESNEVGLDLNVRDNFLYPMVLEEGKVMYICIIGELASVSDIDLDFVFTPDEDESDFDSKELDFRTDDFAPTFSISIRNAETNKPIVANISLDGLKTINGLYKGSDLKYNVGRNFKLTLKCEAEGFFFLDSAEIQVSSVINQELVLKLEPVRSGKTMQIEEIEFKPGTSEIALNGEGKIRRLRDFLALNSTIEIEIQGHVFEPGDDNSHAGQKVSEARAKRVLKYLTDNGIDKSRLTAVGYGNTRPIYADPQHSYEEQANRRVEIIVK